MTDPDAIGAAFTSRVTWYKGSVRAETGGAFDTEVVEYTGRTSGETVRYVFTTLDHDPFGQVASTLDDDDRTTSGTDAPTANPAPLASTGAGVESAMGLGAMERRRD